jgi:hypothetical protein
MQPYTLKLDPMRPQLLTDIALPSDAESNKLKQLPKRAMPYKLQDDPILPRERTLMPEPK